MKKALISAIGLVFVVTGCTHLIYAPTRVKYVDDRKLTHRPEEVHFKALDGKQLTGWYFSSARAEPKGVFVFFHGNGQNLSSHFVLLYWILDHGYDFFIFDYPGYGISEGEPGPRGTVEAGIAAIQWTRARHPHTPLMIYGQSLGGAVALRTLVEMKSEPAPCLLMLDSTFQSYGAVARDVLSTGWLTWPFQPFTYVLINDTWSPKGRVSEIKTPAVVMHSVNDPIVNIRRGRELFAALSGPKVFWEIQEPGHTAGLTGDERERWRGQLLQQLEQHCARETVSAKGPRPE